MDKKALIDFGLKLNLDLKNIELIILKITVLSRSQFFLLKEIEDKYIEKIKINFFRLQEGEPIEYILEESEFMGEKFFVDKRVLIPRDDTEILVLQLIKFIKNQKQEDFLFIDVGVGSGIIPITVIRNLENEFKNCYGIDISKEALEVAEKNIKNSSLKNKIILLKGNLLDPLINKINNLSNNLLITANLPYIKNNDFNNMDKSTIRFEPNLALYGGENTGFELYEILIKQCLELTKIGKNIFLFIEIGFDQYEYSKKYLEKLGLKTKYFKDTNNIYRCIMIFFD